MHRQSGGTSWIRVGHCGGIGVGATKGQLSLSKQCAPIPPCSMPIGHAIKRSGLYTLVMFAWWHTSDYFLLSPFWQKASVPNHFNLFDVFAKSKRGPALQGRSSFWSEMRLHAQDSENFSFDCTFGWVHMRFYKILDWLACGLWNSVGRMDLRAGLLLPISQTFLAFLHFLLRNLWYKDETTKLSLIFQT